MYIYICSQHLYLYQPVALMIVCSSSKEANSYIHIYTYVNTMYVYTYIHKNLINIVKKTYSNEYISIISNLLHWWLYALLLRKRFIYIYTYVNIYIYTHKNSFQYDIYIYSNEYISSISNLLLLHWCNRQPAHALPLRRLMCPVYMGRKNEIPTLASHLYESSPRKSLSEPPYVWIERITQVLHMVMIEEKCKVGRVSSTYMYLCTYVNVR
jgi:hypothetical protein